MLSKVFNSIKSSRASALSRCSAVILAMMCAHGNAQDKLRVNFRSRGLFDLGYTTTGGYNGRLYPQIVDLRVGAKVAQDRWSFKLDIGLSGSKIGIKDILFNYDFKNSNSLTIGNAYEPFSMDIITGSVDLAFNCSASAAQSVANPRRFGATYYIRSARYFGAVGIYTENSINALFDPKTTSSGIALTTKHLYRNYMQNGDLFQIGGAVSWRTVDNRKGYPDVGIVNISSTGCADFLGQNLIEAKIDQAIYNVKGNIELLSIIKRWKIQSECSVINVIRENGKENYMAWGAYLQLSYLMGSNAKYGYDRELAVPSRANRGVELVARIDYVNANDRKSRIYGGNHTDISLGINYFLNRYLAAKFNVTYTTSDSYNHSALDRKYISSVLRLQYSF